MHLAVNEQGVCACVAVRLTTTQHFVETPAGNERLEAGYDGKVGAPLSVLRRFQLADEFFNVCQRLLLSADKRVCFWKQLVLNTDAGHAAAFQLAESPTPFS